jgi:hypothetical protein
MARLCGNARTTTDTSCHSPTISLNSRGLQVLPETIFEFERAAQRAVKVSIRCFGWACLLATGFAECCGLQRWRLRVVQAAGETEQGAMPAPSAVTLRGCGFERDP